MFRCIRLGSSIGSIIHHGLKFFITLHAIAIRKIGTAYRFSICRLNRQDLKWISVTTGDDEFAPLTRQFRPPPL